MPDFPCYSCQSTGEEVPRCKAFMNCLKWCEWAREQNILNEEVQNEQSD